MYRRSIQINCRNVLLFSMRFENRLSIAPHFGVILAYYHQKKKIKP